MRQIENIIIENDSKPFDNRLSSKNFYSKNEQKQIICSCNTYLWEDDSRYAIFIAKTEILYSYDSCRRRWEKIANNSFNNNYNRLQVAIDKNNATVHIALLCDILISHNFRSFGIGSVLMSEVVEFLKLNYANYKVSDIKITSIDAQTPFERQRRNNFYLRFGFKIKPNVDAIDGYVYSNIVSELNKHISAKVSFFPVHSFVKLSNTRSKSVQRTLEYRKRFRSIREYRISLENSNFKFMKYLILSVLFNIFLIWLLFK